MIWVAVAPVALWAFVRVLGLERGFPLVPLMAFTPYAAIAALLVAGVAVALRNWAAAGVTALAVLCLAAVVLPRAVGDGTVEAAGRQTLTVLSANIHHGTGEAEALVELVDRHRPDLLAIQELTPSFAAALQRAGLGRLLPNEVLETRRGVSGSGLYSSLPVRQLAAAQAFAFRQPRAVVRLPDGRRIRVVDVHPYPPQRHHVDQWTEALESLPSTGRGVPWVLIGDFNATLDHSQLREILDRGYRDAGEVAGEGLDPTWPAEDWASRLPGVTIDHVLADQRLGVVDYEVEDLPGSDHRPVYAELAPP
ncbi:MAG TPA: endonuclease/exonuclease/phosphatase family protein [Solirubrobacterales bacterium]|nr:endonuclease/exonuclease/phosphatase family protein [Solirubrobacterales bacterium]